MEYGDDADMVIWESSQAVTVKQILADAPVAPPPLPIQPIIHTTVHSHGVKRKRWQDQDASTPSSAKTLDLIQQVSRSLGSHHPTNTRRTRIASAGALILGPAVKSKAMPPPRMFTESLSAGTSLDSINTPEPGQLHSESSSDSNSTPCPSTPPPRNAQLAARPATEPTITISALINRQESPELDVEAPPSPAKPVLSIRTNCTPCIARVDESAFSSRSNTSESVKTAISATSTGSVVSNAWPTSPATPLPRAATPIIDLSPTPSPEPEIIPPSPPQPHDPPKPSAPVLPPVRPSRSITDPVHAQPAPPTLLSTQHTRSEPFRPPTQQFRPPTQQFRPPTQNPASRPPTQQHPRTFPSSQTRLGLGALGTGYTNANRPFRVPNKGKTASLTITALPRRTGTECVKSNSVGSSKMINGTGNPDRVGATASKADMGEKGKERAKLPTSPTKSRTSPTKRKGSTLNQLSFTSIPPSPSRKKENLASGSENAKSRTKRDVPKKPSSPTPVSRPTTRATPARSSVSTRTNSNSRYREPESEDCYISDEDFDSAVVDADMARWDW
ncbi:hypothetical protein CTheo_5603 [Ceratobasidium theobromae]|uniref:Uncharacterized protein n=1 Tax=Ceratobasidium theobromae TaxID=1582974 RepID=A0A5N5QGS5_9AGAM|nr:hypothetical protein CTheo_5603 [Ceratobasidium theobromae]